MCEECGIHEYEKPVIAVCGKGGVGKTVFSALLSKVLLEEGLKPLLLVDADPVGGLMSAIGEYAVDTLAGVRDRFISEARRGGKTGAGEAADQLDYFILKALVERQNYSLLAMGHNEEKGCFCPANKLLKNAIDGLIPVFKGVLIDAEAGIEQINRDITGRVTRVIAVVDGSKRSMDTLAMVVNLVGSSHVSVVANRVLTEVVLQLPEGVDLLGSIPENDVLRQFDREGRPLWQLPPENEALTAVRGIAKALVLF
jgi:CO dehydrogenase maturation factor